PMQSASNFKKASPPILGEKFGNWAGRDDLYMYSLPGGGFLQFDLSKLTLADYRQMRDHYQIQASLSVLTFMLHQLEFTIECDNRKIATFCQDNLNKVWTRLVRGLSQAFWAGYSPMILQYENDIDGRAVQLAKVKDLVPEECRVNWKEVEGWRPPGKNTIPPKIKIYDGIQQFGAPWPIPVDNTLWYPVLSENGDYYGRKLLRSAFQPYFFSMLMHLFANRYYERFGEPVPIGRAPYDTEVDIGGSTIKGNEAMRQILSNFRNRSVVVLPSDRDEDGNPEYAIEYLESQMRGADFERYMTRLDEEMSLALFTPLLVLRTADVGSYNLGTGQTQVYLWMLNAISGDWAEYIDKYVLKPLKNYNFGERAPDARIRFRKLGTQAQETLRAILTEMVRQGSAKVNLEDLGQAVGMRVEEVREVTQPPAAPANDPSQDPTQDPPADPGTTPKKDTRVGRDRGTAPKGIKQASRVAGLIKDRLVAQYEKALRENRLPELSLDFGYQAQMVAALEGEVDDPLAAYAALVDTVTIFVTDFVTMESHDKNSGADCIKSLVDLWVAHLEKGTV
ncbi:hypothetical protein ACFV42_49380, partial [Streptomyces solisilvae]|uniref:phage portal protein family protein n=1 Tax=Streptomyces malaysiensis TaxID=92644 RepID=UPI0036801601